MAITNAQQYKQILQKEREEKAFGGVMGKDGRRAYVGGSYGGGYGEKGSGLGGYQGRGDPSTGGVAGGKGTGPGGQGGGGGGSKGPTTTKEQKKLFKTLQEQDKKVTKEMFDKGQSNYQEQFNDIVTGSRPMSLSQKNKIAYQNRIYNARRNNIINQLSTAGLLTPDLLKELGVKDEDDLTVEQLRDVFQVSDDTVGADYGDRSLNLDALTGIKSIQDYVDEGFYKTGGVFDKNSEIYDPNRIPKPFNEIDVKNLKGGLLTKSAAALANFLGEKMAGPLTQEYLDKQFNELGEISSLPFNYDQDTSIKGLMEKYEPNRFKLENSPRETGPDNVDPCKGPNPPAYCFVNNDPADPATPTRNFGGLAPRFMGSSFDFTGLADGGRAGFAEGGIMPRLNQLSGSVSSAEQMLQEINQRLESAESSLGSGGGGALANMSNANFNTSNVNLNPGLASSVQTPDPFFGKGGGNQFIDATLPKTLQLAGGATQQPAFGSMEEAYSSFQDKAKEIREGGMMGRVVLPGEMSFEDFSNQMNIKSGFFGMHGAGGVPAGGNSMQSPLQQAVGMADGGMIEDTPEGGIMDLESGRQMYFLGKLVKKATRAVKKVAKSPFGKAALGAALFKFGGGFGGGSGTGILSGLKGKLFGMPKEMIAGPIEGLLGTGSSGTMGLLGKLGLTKGGGSFMPTLKGGITLGLGIPALMDLFGKDKDDDKMDLDEYYRKNSINIADIRNNPYNFLAPRFAADGGLMRTGYQEGGDAEPVAKKTMPLLDMDGMEKDYREEGGFVPIGRMERADDVPARLSKNEFVFTADAVRNAGEGDIDKGAEVMYNMMKNLESGGEVSEESQGLDGAREMFKTSQRLEEVL